MIGRHFPMLNLCYANSPAALNVVLGISKPLSSSKTPVTAQGKKNLKVFFHFQCIGHGKSPMQTSRDISGLVRIS